jgi:hypothetical protein
MPTVLREFVVSHISPLFRLKDRPDRASISPLSMSLPTIWGEAKFIAAEDGEYLDKLLILNG